MYYTSLLHSLAHILPVQPNQSHFWLSSACTCPVLSCNCFLTESALFDRVKALNAWVRCAFRNVFSFNFQGGEHTKFRFTGMGKNGNLISTAREYAEASTIHGVSYVFSWSQIYFTNELGNLVLACIPYSRT